MGLDFSKVPTAQAIFASGQTGDLRAHFLYLRPGRISEELRLHR